jgi:hypothetical protein
MRKAFIRLLAGVSLLAVGTVSGAQTVHREGRPTNYVPNYLYLVRCPASDGTGCIEQFKQDAREWVKDKVPGNYTNKDAAERSKSAGEIVKDCVKCGLDKMKSGMDEIKPRR